MLELCMYLSDMQFGESLSQSYAKEQSASFMGDRGWEALIGAPIWKYLA